MLYLVHLKGTFVRIQYSKTVSFSLVKLSFVIHVVSCTASSDEDGTVKGQNTLLFLETIAEIWFN